jgi:hypothetical protein
MASRLGCQRCRDKRTGGTRGETITNKHTERTTYRQRLHKVPALEPLPHFARVEGALYVALGVAVKPRDSPDVGHSHRGRGRGHGCGGTSISPQHGT